MAKHYGLKKTSTALKSKKGIIHMPSSGTGFKKANKGLRAK